MLLNIYEEPFFKDKWGCIYDPEKYDDAHTSYALTMSCIHAFLVRKDETAAALYFGHKWIHYETFEHIQKMLTYLEDLFLKSTGKNLEPNPMFTMHARYAEIRYWIGNLRCQNPMVHDVCMALQTIIDSPQTYVTTRCGQCTLFAASFHPIDIASAVMGAGFESDLLHLIRDIKKSVKDKGLPLVALTFLDALQHIIDTQHHTKFRDAAVVCPFYLYCHPAQLDEII